MRAIAIDEYGGAEKLELRDIPRPRLSRGEILIRTVAAGVNPVDLAMRNGELAQRMPCAFPLIPGWDVAGVVDELGDGCSRFRTGDRVWAFARKPTVQWGCYADFVAVPESCAGWMPSELSFEEAAAMPMAGIAAYRAVHGRNGVAPRQLVLVHGAAGGVGHLAIQIARAAGARVFGSVHTGGVEMVLDLGAMALDPTKEPFDQSMRRHCPDGVDVVIDTVGGAMLARSWELVRRGGRLVSLVDVPDSRRAAERSVSAYRLSIEPDEGVLARLARAVERQGLRPRIEEVFPIGQASRAHIALEQGRVRGKLVLGAG